MSRLSEASQGPGPPLRARRNPVPAGKEQRLHRASLLRHLESLGVQQGTAGHRRAPQGTASHARAQPCLFTSKVRRHLQKLSAGASVVRNGPSVSNRDVLENQYISVCLSYLTTHLEAEGLQGIVEWDLEKNSLPPAKGLRSAVEILWRQGGRRGVGEFKKGGLSRLTK